MRGLKCSKLRKEQWDMKKQDSMKKREHNDRQQAWEACVRRSVESVSSANGWLKSGYAEMMNESIFFYPSILH